MDKPDRPIQRLMLLAGKTTWTDVTLPDVEAFLNAERDKWTKEAVPPEPIEVASQRPVRAFRRFLLVRDEDVSGTSGTGVVAEGAWFSSGKVVIAWTTVFRSVGVYDSLAEMDAIHGHEGRTRVEWIDPS